MFIFRNAWHSIIRNKGRNALIVIIVAIIAAAATIGLSIRNAAQNARDEGLADTTVTATIGIDREAAIDQVRQQNSGNETPPDNHDMRSAIDVDTLTLDDYERYADASSVPVSTYYTEQIALDGTDDCEPVSTSTDNADTEGTDDSSSDDNANADTSSESPAEARPSGRDGSAISSADFTVTGFSSDTAVANAANGTFTVNDGQVFNYDDDSVGDVIITQTLADFNALSVGDTITLADTDDDTTYTFTIVGIYSNDATQNIAPGGPMGGTDPDNAIYTSVDTLETLGLTDESADDNSTQLTFTYVLNNATDYETFVDDVKEAGLDDSYAVSSVDVDQYESSLVPLNNLATFALTLLLIMLAVGAVVLIVINLFNIRERKYEIGVMLAIGIRKIKVAAQFIIELLIVTMIGIALGVAGGAVASVPVSNRLLSEQISAQQSQMETMQSRFGRDTDMSNAPDGGAPDGGATDGNSAQQDDAPADTANNAPREIPGLDTATQYVSDINATVNLSVVGKLVVIGLALTLISALAGIIAIVRYEPLRILADRS